MEGEFCMHATQGAGLGSPAGLRTWLGTFILALLGTLSVLAQVSNLSTLRGTVTDQSGALVPQVKISVMDQATDIVTNTTTDSRGNYEMPGLKSGYNRLTAQRTGFATLVESDIYLMSNQEKRVDARLTVGASTAQITVSGAAAVIQTEGGSISGETTAAQYKNMPIPGNAYAYPGTVLATLPNVGNPKGNTSVVYFSGQTGNQVAQGMDGFLEFTTGGQQTSNMEAVEELQVLV